MAGNISQSFAIKQSVCKCDTKSFHSDSDSSDSDKLFMVDAGLIRKKKLPPIGVFWDIENCQVPKGRSAVSVAQLIRDLFFSEYREAEFMVVCDVKKENAQIIQELHDAQVTLIHVASTYKNAADEKLRQALRRFADTYEAPAAVILISGDINFAADLSDLRHRKKLHVILIHKENAAEALLLCATEHYNFTYITQTLPMKDTKPVANAAMDVIVRNLPKGHDPVRLRNRLKQLSDNCGGRVVFVSLELGTAVLRFNNLDIAVRAQRRMNGEDVYGHKISAGYPSTVKNWEKSYSPSSLPYRKDYKNSEGFEYYTSYEFSAFTPKNYLHSKQNSQLKKDQTNDLVNNFSNSDTWRSKSAENIPWSWPIDIIRTLSPLEISEKDETEQIGHPKIGHYFKDESCALCGPHGGFVFNDFTNADRWRPKSADNMPNSWPDGIIGRFLGAASVDNKHSDTNKSSDNIPLENNTPIDLVISNLDQNLSPEDLKKLLLIKFREYVTVINISIFYQSANNLIATVRLSNPQDALTIMSKLNRRKIGRRKITITYTEPNVLHNQVVTLLQEASGNQLPVFKLREMLNIRFKSTISNSELHKIKNVVLCKGNIFLKSVIDNATGDNIFEEIHSEQIATSTPKSSSPNNHSTPQQNSPLTKFANGVQSPNPSELPMPSEELLNKCRNISSSGESERSDSSRVTPEKKRHNRLAANFSTPMI